MSRRSVRALSNAFPAVLSLAVLVLGAACERGPSISPPAVKPVLPGIPATVTVKQRSTVPLPGTDGPLRLTIDDITRGQVIASLATADNKVVAPPASLAPGGAASFAYDGNRYVLALDEFSLSVLGADYAVFTLAAAAALTEEAKIERLIASLADLSDAVFVRNEAKYTAKEAAEHLRSKWSMRAADIPTADEFIERIASRSSVTGDPYRIELPDGTVVKSGDFLRQRLAEIESGR